MASHPFYPGPIAPTPEQERASQKGQAGYFRSALGEVDKRIEELGKAKQEESGKVKEGLSY